MANCEIEACDHELFHEDRCACHLDLDVFHALTDERRVEAVRIAALENEQFDVNAEGDIRLKEGNGG